ncbi:MAG TPA: capsule assembly Wzi family protein [Longimicrobium sp.]|jgi:hypothetical protein|uniref:capsule assembly Wzi family protein n=1 Tax=Longimicrobium sp. TaxID=2029185 RepID=UPI002EDAD448
MAGWLAAGACAAVAGPLEAQRADAGAVPADTGAAVTRPAGGEQVPSALSGAGIGHRGASPLVPAEHWAVRAARRAEALGLAPGYLPAQTAVPRHTVATALEAAAAHAAGTRYQALAAGWLVRFREEFREYSAGREAAGMALLGGRAQAGYEGESGRVTPVISYGPWRIESQPVEERSEARARVEGAVRLGGRAALFAHGRADRESAAMARWEGVAAAGPYSLSIGRQPVGYGPGVGGAVVLFPNTSFNRLEAQTIRPVRLPSVLRYLGPVSLHTFASRMDEPARHPEEAWMWGARVAAQPHPRLTLGINRASIFGNEGEPITPERVLRMAAGVIRGSNFENQILSFDGRLRLPTERWLPATLYVETGADDGAGALDEVPGTVAGVFFPALPALPGVAGGAEYARFAESVLGHGPWYFNSSQRGNWARRSWPLGHPLGGEGREVSGYAQAELLNGRLRVDGRGFVRTRSAASLEAFGGANLFAPVRVGRSRGGALTASMRLRGVDLTGSWYRDAGDGWREQRLQAGVAAFF